MSLPFLNNQVHTHLPHLPDRTITATMTPLTSCFLGHLQSSKVSKRHRESAHDTSAEKEPKSPLTKLKRKGIKVSILDFLHASHPVPPPTTLSSVFSVLILLTENLEAVLSLWDGATRLVEKVNWQED